MCSLLCMPVQPHCMLSEAKGSAEKDLEVDIGGKIGEKTGFFLGSLLHFVFGVKIFDLCNKMCHQDCL